MKQKLRNFLFIINFFGILTTTKKSNFSLFGSISDKKTGEPINEATVIVFIEEDVISEKTTDKNGNYEFNNLSTNYKYTLKVLKNGYYYFHSEELIFWSGTSENFDIKLIKMNN